MKKRKGVALISVLIVVVFTIILTLALLNVYSSSVKQKTYSNEFDKSEFAALSGLSVMVTYVTEYNTEFETNFPFSTGYINIPLENNYTADVYVTKTVLDSKTIEYNLKSIPKFKNEATGGIVSCVITKTAEDDGTFTYETDDYDYN